MAGKSPIVKRVGAFKFELIDMFDLYSHRPCLAKGGKVMIENVNQMDNEIVVRSINNPTNIFTTDVRNLKLMLRDMSTLRGKDIKIIAGLALGEEGFSGSSSMDGKKIIISSDMGSRVVIDLSDNDLAISTVKRNKMIETKNLPYIIAYLITNGFDLFGLLARGFAITSNIVKI